MLPLFSKTYADILEKGLVLVVHFGFGHKAKIMTYKPGNTLLLPIPIKQLLIPFQDTPVEVEQNTDLPEYLPEDESPSKEQDKAVSRVGSHPEGAANWLSTAANFLSRSFYW